MTLYYELFGGTPLKDDFSLGISIRLPYLISEAILGDIKLILASKDNKPLLILLS